MRERRMLYQLDMASFFFYKFYNSYLCVAFATEVTYLLVYMPINRCLESEPQAFSLNLSGQMAI